MFLCGSLLAGVAGADPLPVTLGSHPCLLIDSNGLVQLKQRIAETSWARESWADLTNAAARSLNRPVSLPPRGGNWSHNYVCPTHGARLSQGSQIGPWQWEHICPVGHHVLHGNPEKATLDFDGNAIAGVHGNYAQQVIDDGLVYQVTGDTRYARKAREILLAYAQVYLGYPLHDNQGRRGQGGRVASQSLTEASWLIDLAQGADLVWPTLTEEQRHTLETKLLRPALDEIIIPRRLGIHNIQCRHNSAIGLVGFLLGDQKLISLAIDDPGVGFRHQLGKGVLDDGMWVEGASGYHFFTIAGLWPLAEAARNCGLDLYSPKFRSMFDGPLALAMPDFVLPNFNDSGTVALENEADLYELAFARFHAPAFARLLADSDRHGRLALLYGVSHLPAADPLSTTGTHNSAASGYAILRRGADKNATWLCVKYGPHGGGHGHPDKNTFILYAHGQILATDAGTHAYGSPLHRDWDKTTLAHNTLVVDEASQAPATGQCLAFGTKHGIDYSITDAGPIYPGVDFIRTAVSLTPQLVVFVDQVRADAVHTYDLAYHQIGTWDAPATNQAAQASSHWLQPSAPGYSRLSRTFTRPLPPAGLQLSTMTSEGWHPAIALAPGEPTEIISGYGLLKTTEDFVPVLIQRRHTQSTTFVWGLALDGTALKLRCSRVTDPTGQALPAAQAVLVQVWNGASQWSLLVNPHRRDVLVSPPGGAPWRSQECFALAQTP